MTFRKGAIICRILYGEEPLELLTEFKYLGIIFQMNGRNFMDHDRERVVPVVVASHGIKYLSRLSITTAMKVFDLKIFVILTYGIEIILKHFTKMNLTDIDRVKSTFLNRAIYLSKYKPSRLTYVLASETCAMKIYVRNF
jgi:hypothetical protein